MSTKDWIFLGLMTLAVLLIGVIIGTEADLKNYRIVTACESELPRNEHCIVIAVPEKGE